MPIRLICHELKRLTDDYYKCENIIIKDQIYSDIKLLSKALFLSDQPGVETPQESTFSDIDY